MKHIYLIGMMMAFAISTQAQIVFQSDVSSWSNNLPTDFVGSKTNMNTDSISEVMMGVNAGTSAANIRNAASGHRRFTTQGVTVMDGQTYEINMWVRGQGEIRTGLYDGRATGSGYAGYNSYETINTSTWQLVTQSIICAYDTTGGEFIISVRNTGPGVGLDIDSVVIGVGIVVPPTQTSIYSIQFTTNSNGDSPLLNSQVITGGIVSQSDSSGYFIQENEAAWSGIYVFDSSMPSIGDSVIVEGTVAEYFNSTQITSLTSYTNAGAIGAPNPVVLSTSDCNLEDWESVLVRTVGPCVNDDIMNNFGQWQLDDGSGAIWIDDLFYDYAPVQGQQYRVTGPATYSFNERKILPRDANDVEVIISVNEILFANLSVYPNPANEVLNVDLGENANASYAILDISGRMIENSQLNGRFSTINTDALSSGQYFLQLTNALGTQSIRFSIR